MRARLGKTPMKALLLQGSSLGCRCRQLRLSQRTGISSQLKLLTQVAVPAFNVAKKKAGRNGARNHNMSSNFKPLVVRVSKRSPSCETSTWHLVECSQLPQAARLQPEQQRRQ